MGIWSYRLTSKRSKTLLISLSEVSGVVSYLCRRERHSELSSPCSPWYHTSDATAEGPGCRVLLYTCPNTLLWTFSNQLLCRETLLQTSQSLRHPPDRAKDAIKQQGSRSAFISLKDWFYPRIWAMNRNPSSTHSWSMGIWDCWGCKTPVNEADHSGQIGSEVTPTLC